MTTGRINQISIEIRPKANFQFASEEQVFSDAKHFYAKAKTLENSFSKVFCNQTKAHTQVSFPKAALTKTEFDKCIRNLVLLAKINFSKRKETLLLAKRQLSPLENACEQ